MMSYVAKVLQPGETVLGTARLHMFIYLPSIGALVIAVVFFIATYFVREDFQFLTVAGTGLSALIAAYAALGEFIHRSTTELAVTDHRVIYKTGIFSRHTIEMNRAKIESVDVEQSIAGRLFGFGTIILRGTGGTFEPIANIADPLTFRSHITVG